MFSTLRLDRYLVALAVGSRSQVQALIRSGAVSVEGEVQRNPSLSCREGAAITLRGEALDTRLQRHYLLHKPARLLTAARDPRQPTVMSLMPPECQTLGCMPVGRLDKDTTGLLLLTTDGELNHRLLAPGRHVEKTYLATVDGPLNGTDVLRFAQGLDLGDFTALPAKLEIVSAADTLSVGRVTLREGKYHQVKRMFEAIGRQVTALHRERFGPLRLGELPPGQWRELNCAELHAIYEAVGLSDPQEAE